MTNVLATIALGMVRRGSRAKVYWWVVVKGGRVVGIAGRTPPRGLLLSPMPPGAAACLAEAVFGVFPR
jgi:hypothetical protein